MGDPHPVLIDVHDGHQEEVPDALVPQGPGDHEMTLPGREGVVEGVRDLRAPYANYQLVALLGDLPDHLQVPQVEGLEAPYQQAVHALYLAHRLDI